MVLQIVIGLLGLYYHFSANLKGTARSIEENFIFGAPVFASLLFTNLALLGILDLQAEAAKNL